jgi:uncharacterized protein YodC (DUF2158 family)
MAEIEGFEPGQRVMIADHASPPLFVVKWDAKSGLVRCVWTTAKAMGEVEVHEDLLRPYREAVDSAGPI